MRLGEICTEIYIQAYRHTYIHTCILALQVLTFCKKFISIKF